MEYNQCSTCGAEGGRCGMMIKTTNHGKSECLNCNDTRESGKVTIHSNLKRTDAEINRTIGILVHKLPVAEHHRIKNGGSMEINGGMKILDLDPRMKGRVLSIASADNRYAYCHNSAGRNTRILLSRIFIDGKKRKSGFSLVEVEK